ncbi:MAG: ABC transporter ATP-binding protein [Acutalibacteraceae bacterium]|nr:ABC transporter ATP-binding protein [Acutalibacteraceae bacterium]
MIEISSLYAGYGDCEILHDVSLVCDSGKITTLIGPNGCGKSTLLKTVIGMLPIKKGDVILDGVSLQKMPDNIRAQKISYLSQGKNIPDITVERMVLHGRFPYLSYPRKYRKCDFEAAQNAMQKMGFLPLAKKPVSKLSGGMRQKVYIAMALCQGTDVIMMDEPNTYLDISQQLKISQISKELALNNKTVLTVSHDIISALKISDKIAVMSDGKIIYTGTPSQVVESGVVEKVFGVKILSFEADGEQEFYYKQTEARL